MATFGLIATNYEDGDACEVRPGEIYPDWKLSHACWSSWSPAATGLTAKER